MAEGPLVGDRQGGPSDVIGVGLSGRAIVAGDGPDQAGAINPDSIRSQVDDAPRGGAVAQAGGGFGDIGPGNETGTVFGFQEEIEVRVFRKIGATELLG
jgi:hypothetical protein